MSILCNLCFTAYVKIAEEARIILDHRPSVIIDKIVIAKRILVVAALLAAATRINNSRRDVCPFG
jgi:hypothetical protein